MIEGSGSLWPKNMWIRIRIRIRNTADRTPSMEKTIAKRTLPTEKERAKRASWSTELEELRLKMARQLRRWTWTGDFKCREVKTGFFRKRWMQTGSSWTLIGWKSGQTTFVPLWDWMGGAWLRTLDKPFQCEVCRKSFSKQLDLVQHSLATGHVRIFEPGDRKPSKSPFLHR